MVYKYSNTRGRPCDWVSSKISGTHIVCILLFSSCLFITCHPFAIHRSIGSEDVFGKRTPWNTEEILPDGTISEMIAMAHGIPINYYSILKYILFFTTWKWINSVQVHWIFLGGMKLLQNGWKVPDQAQLVSSPIARHNWWAASFRSDSSEVMEDEAPMMQTRAPETQSVA